MLYNRTSPLVQVVVDGSMDGIAIDAYRVPALGNRDLLGGLCGLLQVEVLQQKHLK